MKKIVFTLLLSLLAFPALAAEKESAYDRVVQTGTIRCGYLSLPPFIIKDPNTGEISGIIHDTMERAGDLLGVKIDWNEEVGLATMDAGLEAGRYDALCFGYYKNPMEAKLGTIGFSDALFYVPMSVFARADDRRFDDDLSVINDPSIWISVHDGSLDGVIASEDFPLAKKVSLPNMTDFGMSLQEVVNGKADVAILNLVDGINFEKLNPGKVRNVSKDQPIRVYAATIAYPQQDTKFGVMLDAALDQIRDSGYIRNLSKKYQAKPGAIFHVARPYEMEP